MWYLRGIFVSGTNLAIICEVAAAVACIVADMDKHFGSICPLNIMSVWLIFAMW